MRRLVLTALCIALLASAAYAASEHVPGVVLVRWRSSVRVAERATVRADLSAQLTRDFPEIGVEQLALASLSVEEAVLRLTQDPRIEFAEPDYLVGLARTPDDPRFSEQWALHNTGQTGGVAGADARAVRGWDLATDARAVLVGVVDTGADLTHPDLVSELWVNPGEVAGNGVDDDANGYVDDVHGYDFLNRDGDPSDDNGHGTHVAGIIAARGDNGLGVTGIAWRGRMMVLKFLGASGTGPVSAGIEAILYAARMGARVVNHSWGGSPNSQALMEAFAVSGRAGVTSVVAAGNSGLDLESQPSYPASLDDPDMVTVAATDAADGLAAFSNRGSVSVDLGAPGVGVLSLAPGGRYVTLSGTSMAAPHVAGAAALLLAQEPDLDPVSLRLRLLRSAWPLASLQGRTVSGGRLDLLRLLAVPEDEPPSGIADLRTERIGSHAVWLQWTAPGDDGDVGRADRYLLRIATGAVGSIPFEDMLAVSTPEPSIAGTTERVRIGGLEAAQSYWVAMRAIDDHGNGSPLASPLAFTTQPPPHGRLQTERIEADLSPGATERHEVALVNDSQGTLEWRLESATLDSRIDGPTSAGGYRVIGAQDPLAAPFDWVARGPEAVTVALQGDEGISAPIALPFAFSLFGHEYRSLRIASNGFITFLGEDPAPQPMALPSARAPRAMVAPFWADLDPGPSARRVWMHADPLRVVITWQETRPFGSPTTPLTFQLWLLRTGEIRFQYLVLSDRSALAGAGLQGVDGATGIGLSFRSAILRDSLAVRFVPPRRWAIAAPAAGVLGPGERGTIRVDLESRGLEDGVQQDTLWLASDDASAPRQPLALRLRARAAPGLVVSDPRLDFGVTSLGREAAQSLGVANEGALPAQVSVMALRDGAFHAEGAGFRLAPGEARSIPVSFRPGRLGEQRSRLTVLSDDPRASRTELPLTGEGIEAARLRLSAPALRGAVARGLRADAEVDEVTLAIDDPGGMPLHWRLTSDAGARPEASSTERGAGIAASGGPDPAGYRWSSSDEPGAPAFEWRELDGIGRRLFGAADDSVHVGIALPFEFPFYGRMFSGISVCTNGWLAFESTIPLREGRVLPDPGAPLGLIAPFWTDLDARDVDVEGGVYAHGDAERFIVEWKDIRRFGRAERLSFQVWLWRDGRIEFQYLAMPGAGGGATIGLQDADGLRGLTAAHNTALARDSLRLSFRNVPHWLSTARHEGVLAPGARDSVRVRMSSEGLAPGIWTGALRFALDGIEPATISVPCTLVVGPQEVAAHSSQRRLVAASRTPTLDVVLEASAPPAASVWIDAMAFSPDTIERLPDGRARLRFATERLLAALPTDDRVRAVTWRDPLAGWRVARVPLDLARLPLEVVGLPGEAEAAPEAREAGSAQRLELLAPAGVTRLEAWLRTAPGEWTLVGSSASAAIDVVWPLPMADTRLELLAFQGTELTGVWRSSALSIQASRSAPIPERLALSLRGSHPSPAPVALELALPRAAAAEVDVFDLRGARVRRLAQATFVAGRHPLVWDGRDATGGRAAAGVYVLRVRSGGQAAVRRVVLLPGP